MKVIHFVLAFVLVLLCGAVHANCTGMSGATVTSEISPICLGCAITEADAVADGDEATRATLRVPVAPLTQGAAVRATASSAYPAGSRAGALVSVPPGIVQSYYVTINTYLSGAIQESSSSDNSGGGCGICGGHNAHFDGFVTTKSFDAVEVLISDVQALQPADFGVYEMCSDN